MRIRASLPLLLAAVAPAQIELPPPLLGTYVVDPQGKGPNVFRDLATAVRYVSLIGVTGSVDIEVRPGRHAGALLFYPVPGLQAGQQVRIRGVGDGEAILTAEDGIVKLNDGCHDLVLERLVFGDSGSGPAVQAGSGCTDIEIRHCRFTEDAGAQRLIEIQGENTTRRWNVHHNRFELGSGPSAAIYTQGTYELHIHHNEFVCRDAREPISLWNANKSESSVRDNVFLGTIADTCMRLDVSGHDVDVCGNLFYLEVAGDAVIRSQGLKNGAWNRIRHNLFVLRGAGAAVRTGGPLQLEHNVYALQEGRIGLVENNAAESLAAWQEALGDLAVDGKADTGSAVSDARLFTNHRRVLDLLHRFPDDPARAGTADDKPELPYLLALLAEQDPAVLRLAIHCLSRHGARALPAVPALGRLCSHPHAAVRADAATVLGAIRVGAEVVIPELVNLLQDGDERVLVAVLDTLAGFGHLAAAASDRVGLLRSHAAETVRAAAARTGTAITAK